MSYDFESLVFVASVVFLIAFVVGVIVMLILLIKIINRL